MVTQQVHVKTVSRVANCLTSCLSFNRPFMSNNQMNRTAQGPEARQKQREKCTATNTITAITRVPMIHRAVPSAMHIEQNTSQKMLKGQTPPPFFYISSILVLTSPPTPAATLLQFLSSGPVQFSSDVVLFFPLLPSPPLLFLVKLFLFISITSFFIIFPIEWNSAYWGCIFRGGGGGPGAQYFGHKQLPDFLPFLKTVCID
jgi:hypothetical protein